MAGGGFLNKGRRGSPQQDHQVQTDKLALQAGMRQQHREGTDSRPEAGGRTAILGALDRAKSGDPSGGENRFAHGDSDPSKRHAYGAHHGGK